MIRLPKLDDQKYDDIVNSARSKIPKLLPEWTNFNVHDPGITLIELLSWLKEMQQYHLDQITDKNKLKFLKLLGCMPEHIKPAGAGIVVENNGLSFALPQGSRFYAGEVVFEADSKTWLAKNNLSKIAVFDGDSVSDVSRVQKELDIAFYAFGERQIAGSTMNMGFDGHFEAGRTYRLWVSVFDDYPVKRNPVSAGKVPMLNGVEWEMQRAGEWVSINALKDSTNGFLNNGYVEFNFDYEPEAGRIEGIEEELYWIRARLVKQGCEESPKIFKIYNNFITARQKETLSEVHEFKLSEGENCLAVETWLSLFGELELQLETSEGGWKFLKVEEEGILVERDYANGRCNIKYNMASKPCGMSENCRIRVLCHDRSFMGNRFIGASNGLPHQKFSSRNIGRLVKENLIIQVAEKDKQGDILYYDWNFTDELDIADGNKRVFSLDNRKMEIAFGDNENGQIPAAGKLDMLFAACSTTLGVTGNINNYEINDIFDYAICADGNIGELNALNINDCTGGRDDETIAGAMARVRKELGVPSRAVTIEDFEYLVRATPGLRISDVKAIPNSSKGNTNVSVVVVPYSSKPRPKPDREYMEIVNGWLENYRLIGSTINMIEPQYVEISVYAEVVPEFYTETLEKRIMKSLDEYFDSTTNRGSPRKLGDPVFESDIIGYINSLEQVSYVKRVSLSARGNGWSKSPGGDIFVPFNAVICSGNHEVGIQEF